ncbi:hypothetical protein AB0G32_38325, partial [Streptomyces sp. NPDC023723]
RDEVAADRAEARRPVPEVRSVPGGSPHPGAAKETDDGGYRYALPTVLVRGPGGRRAVPGWRPFEAYAAAVDAVRPGLRAAGRALAPTEALERFRSLTEPERSLLAPGPWPPAGAVRVDTAGGPLWLHPDEATTHPASTGRTATRFLTRETTDHTPGPPRRIPPAPPAGAPRRAGGSRRHSRGGRPDGL